MGDTQLADEAAFDDVELFGGEHPALVESRWGVRVHRDLLEPLERLDRAAGEAGFELAIASGYRSFDRQRAIWNAKASGQRPLLDEQGRPLDPRQLDDEARLHAILRWSALPGASRHHWGTDMDVYEAGALAPGQTLALTRDECEGEGPFAAFHRWLDGFLRSPDNPGFYRPYDRDRGGVSPEPWHLSYAPLANPRARATTCDRLARFLAGRDFALREPVLANLPDIYRRYVAVPLGAEGQPDER